MSQWRRFLQIRPVIDKGQPNFLHLRAFVDKGPIIFTDKAFFLWWLGGLLVERRTSVSPIRGSIPGQVAAV